MSETQNTRSADGTTIAYQAYGEGPAVVFVGGATQRKEDWTELAQALCEAGFTAVTYDRRGRGDSGDTTPYAVEREVEDLAAVIAANGGTAGVHGQSSGGALADRATAAGLPITSLSTFETPYRVGEGPKPPADYLEHLQDLYDADQPAAMLEYFMTAGVGQPQEAVDQMKQLPFWEALVPLGRTVLYDGYCLGSSHAPLPTDLLATITVPVLTLGSTGSPDWLRAGAEAAAAAVPDGRFVVLEGEFHSAPIPVLAPVLADHHRR
ncbi:MAG TPA: alpha/beta fold hydrolase [Nocardioides sp.]|jgi:pimeloyl-ACP methyl ester carboxylesterase|nr:alpha/beta fold hydrolase [Nocardioides sp.]